MIEKWLQNRDEGLDWLGIKYVRCLNDQNLKRTRQMEDGYAYAKTAGLDRFLVFLWLGVFQAFANRVLYCVMFVY